MSFVVSAYFCIFASYEAVLPALTHWGVAQREGRQHHGWYARTCMCALIGSLPFRAYPFDRLKAHWGGLEPRLPTFQWVQVA